jgi:hypothetical protein
VTGEPAATPALQTVEVAGGAAWIDLPVGWVVETGPPTVAVPRSWSGEPPVVVVSVDDGALAGEALASALAAAAATRLADPVILSLGLVDRDEAGARDGDGDGDGDDRCDVQIVVAHRHRGVDVTTVERHHCHPPRARWVVGFTVAHPDVAGLLPLAHRVASSLRVES